MTCDRGAAGLNAAAAAMAKELHLKVGDLPFTVSGLADHMPIHYATHLWNALVDPCKTTQVKPRARNPIADERCEMVTAEQATQPDLEKRTRLLAAVLFVLGGLAMLAPLMAGANAESRVGLLLVLAAVIELYHGFRRSSEEGRKAAWQSGAVTVLMGILVLNSDTLIFSAFLLIPRRLVCLRRRALRRAGVQARRPRPAERS